VGTTRWRALALTGSLLLVWLVSWVLSPLVVRAFGADDIYIATSAGRALLSGDLRVYAHWPEAQMGPLALLLAGALPRWLFVGLVSAFFPALLHWVVLPHVRDRGTAEVAAIGVLVAVLPWCVLALAGHADDPLVYVGAAGVVAGLRSDRPGLAGLAFVVALVGKPTAVVLLPLLWVRSPRLALGALAAAALVWAPFVLADVHGFLRAGAGITPVWAGGVPALLGEPVDSAYPAWVRPAQLVGGLLLCWLLARRGAWTAAVLAAFAWRALLEPAPLASYSIPLVLFALALDVERRRSLATVALGLASWVVCYLTEQQQVVALLRTPLLLVLLVVAVASGRRTPVSPSDAPVRVEESKI
jgi:hypothetical protein